MKIGKLLILIIAAGFLAVAAGVRAEEQFTASVKKYGYRLPEESVVGAPTWCKIKPKETMLDIARRYGLGFNEVDLLYPRMDAWIPPDGKRIVMPTFWVLPPTQHEQLVINLAELRIYFFEKNAGTVQTFPIGIGDEGWESPLGIYSIIEKRPNPIWYVPKSLQAKYGMASMPPGPENPLGEYVMKFLPDYGVHGTAMPWGVGRLVSHGCIRCYPEHIRILYPQVPLGTKIEVIYEPIKFGQKGGQIYVEVHPDVYRKFPDFDQFAAEKLSKYPQSQQVDQKKYMMAVHLQSGVPTNVSRIAGDDNCLKIVEFTQE